MLVVILGLLGVVTIAVLSLTVGRSVKTYDPGSVEGVTQNYLQAVFDGKFDEAATYLATDSECDASDLDRAFIQQDIRISFAEVSTDGDRSMIRITAEIPNGRAFGGYFEEQHSLRLVLQGGEWRLTGIPWPLYDCTPPKS